MATPTWPYPLVNSTILEDGYIPQPQSNLVSSDNEIGPRTTMRRYSAVSTLHPITLKLSRTEYKAFVSFVTNDLRGGSLNFLFRLPDFSQFDTDPEAVLEKEGRFYVKTGEPPYKIKNFFGEHVFITFTFEELP